MWNSRTGKQYFQKSTLFDPKADHGFGRILEAHASLKETTELQIRARYQRAYMTHWPDPCPGHMYA